jgi:CHAD domain-containing protein
MPHEGRELAAQCKRVQDALGDWRDLDQALELLGKAGNGLYPETWLWLKELKGLKNSSWKRYEKVVRALRKTLG